MPECQNCQGTGQQYAGDVVIGDCVRCDGTGWDDGD